MNGDGLDFHCFPVQNPRPAGRMAKRLIRTRLIEKHERFSALHELKGQACVEIPLPNKN
jgi:hypothetical protein